MDRCKGDLQCLELCEDCFKNLSTNDVDWFTNACSKRHRVVLAAKGKYPSWPAKVMLEEEDIISVQFFGDYSTARVMAEEVVPYSRNYLNKYVKHRKALNECLPVSKFVFPYFKTNVEGYGCLSFSFKTGTKPVP